MAPRRYIFRKQRVWVSSPFLMFVLLLSIMGGLFITQGFRRGDVKPLFMPTPTPTRVALSFANEAETHYKAGNLDAAIASYQEAISVDPENGRLYAEMAMIMTYSTQLKSTEREKQARFDQAIEAAEQAVLLSPDDSTAHAVRAFALDWYAGFVRYILLDPDQATRLLTDAEQAVSRAITLDETNVLAQVFRAEIMNDQMRWDQANASIAAALERAPDLWDAHRVNGLILESQGYYMDSIDAFKEAVRLAPNMTFLYIKLGQSYRSLALKTNSDLLYDQAIDHFAQAAALNEQLGIQDPIPYLGIGRTYAQIGESLASSLNMNKALQYNPYDPDVYAQLGMVYRQARNYEDANSALKSATRGCTAEETCALRKCDPDVDQPIIIEGMNLTGLTVVYYYSYASLLAAMYLPSDARRANYCNEAMDMIGEIRASAYGSDQTISDILSESESICRAMTSGGRSSEDDTGPPAATPDPTQRVLTQTAAAPTPTRTPIPTATLFPTPKPPSP